MTASPCPATSATASRRGSLTLYAHDTRFTPSRVGTDGPLSESYYEDDHFEDNSSADAVMMAVDSPFDHMAAVSTASASAIAFATGRRRSSSCNILVGGAPMHMHNGAPSSSNTTLYKVKRSHSSKSPLVFNHQTDVSITEIRNVGLKAILQSKVPLCYFLYHLLQEFSSENLFFFIELEQYESFSYLSLIQQLATAQHIYDTYLSPNSHFEVNIDEKTRRAAAVALQERRVVECFVDAKKAVYTLLESSFMRFGESDTWNLMISQCGEDTIQYDAEIRDAAVNALLSYVEQQHAMLYTNPHTDAPLSMCHQTAKKRHELTKSMIHEFCRTVVGVEFNYYNIWSPDDDDEHEQLDELDIQMRGQLPPQRPSQEKAHHHRSPFSHVLKRPRPKEVFDFLVKKKK